MPRLDLQLHPHGAGRSVAPGMEVEPLRHRIEAYGSRVSEAEGRAFVPALLAAAGISGPDVGRLQPEGSLGPIRLKDVSLHRPGHQAGSLAASGVGTLVMAHFSSRHDDVGLLAAQAPVTAGPATFVAAPDLDRIPFPRRPALRSPPWRSD